MRSRRGKRPSPVRNGPIIRRNAKTSKAKPKARVAEEREESPLPVIKKRAPPVREASPAVEVLPPRRRPRTIVKDDDEQVIPPPEFCPLDVMENCPKIKEIMTKEHDGGHGLGRLEMILLQQDIEHLLAFASDQLTRATGEVRFLTSGDYPTINLSNRPSASYETRIMPEVEELDNDIDDIDETNGSKCKIPVNFINDDLDIWPPNHMPTRFWKIAMEFYLKPIDLEYLEEFKKFYVAPLVPREFDKLYINEPWKHKIRNDAKKGKRKSDLNSLFLDSALFYKRMKPALRDVLDFHITNLVDIVCKEERMPPRPKRHVYYEEKVGSSKRVMSLYGPPTEIDIKDLEKYFDELCVDGDDDEDEEDLQDVAEELLKDFEFDYTEDTNDDPDDDAIRAIIATIQQDYREMKEELGPSTSDTSSPGKRCLRSPKVLAPKTFIKQEPIEQEDIEEEMEEAEPIAVNISPEPIHNTRSHGPVNGKRDSFSPLMASPQARKRNGERKETQSFENFLKEQEREIKRELNEESGPSTSQPLTNGHCNPVKEEVPLKNGKKAEVEVDIRANMWTDLEKAANEELVKEMDDNDNKIPMRNGTSKQKKEESDQLHEMNGISYETINFKQGRSTEFIPLEEREIDKLPIVNGINGKMNGKKKSPEKKSPEKMDKRSPEKVVKKSPEKVENFPEKAANNTAIKLEKRASITNSKIVESSASSSKKVPSSPLLNGKKKPILNGKNHSIAEDEPEKMVEFKVPLNQPAKRAATSSSKQSGSKKSLVNGKTTEKKPAQATGLGAREGTAVDALVAMANGFFGEKPVTKAEAEEMFPKSKAEKRKKKIISKITPGVITEYTEIDEKILKKRTRDQDWFDFDMEIFFPSRVCTNSNAEDLTKEFGFFQNDQLIFTDEEELYHVVGAGVIEKLVEIDILEEFVKNVYHYFLGHDQNIYVSEEGKLPEDSDELDEVSCELVTAQTAMKQMEPEIKGIVDYVFKKLVGDFCFWESYKTMDDVDRIAIRLAVNIYHQFPARLPLPDELDELEIAIEEREDEAIEHFGDLYEEICEVAIEGATEVEESEVAEDLL